MAIASAIPFGILLGFEFGLPLRFPFASLWVSTLDFLCDCLCDSLWIPFGFRLWTSSAIPFGFPLGFHWTFSVIASAIPFGFPLGFEFGLPLRFPLGKAHFWHVFDQNVPKTEKCDSALFGKCGTIFDQKVQFWHVFDQNVPKKREMR